jgi:hypothetical protein
LRKDIEIDGWLNGCAAAVNALVIIRDFGST